MKYVSTTFFLLFSFIISSAQISNDIESTLKYPDELVFDKSLMNYTIYKPNISISCRYKLQQVSKTPQRTVFLSTDSTLKMSFAFFDMEKLPFYTSADSEFQSAYKFYAWDSASRANSNMQRVTVIQSDVSRNVLFYREITGDKTNIYLVGTKNKILSLILFSGKELDSQNFMSDMTMSFLLNGKE